MSPRNSQKKSGVPFAVFAFTFWGLAPVYFKAVSHVTPFEVLAHRIIWSVPITAALITLLHGWPELRQALNNKTVLRTLLLTSLLVAVNWFTFIYAIGSNQVLASSLGYFINPLVNVAMGMVFLKERLRRPQILAILLATAGTINQTIQYGSLPWISLVLAFTFGTYGYLRKTVQIESLAGLFVETSLLFAPALGYLIIIGFNGHLAFGTLGGTTTVLLILAGVVNTAPLISFTIGARRLPLTVLGLCQYIAPTLHFTLAVFIYREPFGVGDLLTFILIWTGLGIFMTDSFAYHRRYNRKVAP
jgi:chloramphenicol-sensitive protein RarD